MNLSMGNLNSEEDKYPYSADYILSMAILTDMFLIPLDMMNRNYLLLLENFYLRLYPTVYIHLQNICH